MSEATMVYDAKDKILGRLASQVAKDMISARKSGTQQRVIIINAEEAIVSGARTQVLSDYRAKSIQGPQGDDRDPLQPFRGRPAGRTPVG